LPARLQKPGFGTGAPHGSIFATPDSIEGRVGVTGSGQGMTEFEQARDCGRVGAACDRVTARAQRKKFRFGDDKADT
jgi:hypothetical protein